VKAALDSSVLIAAYISRAGVCAELLEDIFMHHQLVTSEYILEEVTRKLSQKFRFAPELVMQLRESILATAQCVEPADIPIGSCRDPNDLPVLGTAMAAQADVLITVDKDLLELRRFAGFSIVKPGEFWHLAHG
jgi:putative PIN family toxin of toxin-antitoxin system